MATTTRRAAAAALAAMGAAACAPLFSRVAFAQDPRAAGGSQRIIVPFAAGGTADGLGRLVAEILNELLAAQYTIDNRSGRNGSLGAEIAARARPDGRTLLLGTLGTAVTNPYLYKHLEYDAEGSFTPVALVGEVANVLLVHPAFPALYARGLRRALQEARSQQRVLCLSGSGRDRPLVHGVFSKPGRHPAAPPRLWRPLAHDQGSAGGQGSRRDGQSARVSGAHPVGLPCAPSG